jgi:hypothetical protein
VGEHTDRTDQTQNHHGARLPGQKKIAAVFHRFDGNFAAALGIFPIE